MSAIYIFLKNEFLLLHICKKPFMYNLLFKAFSYFYNEKTYFLKKRECNTQLYLSVKMYVIFMKKKYLIPYVVQK